MNISPIHMIKGISAFLPLFLWQCGRSASTDNPTSNLANIQLHELKADGYDSYEIALIAQSDQLKSVQKATYPKGHGSIKLTVSPGEYRILLNYFQGTQLVFGADFCKEEKKNNIVKLVSGHNEKKITICDQEQVPLNAELTIEPIFESGEGGTIRQTSNEDTGASGADQIYGKSISRKNSWYVVGSKIFYSGEEVELKGVNWFGFDTEKISLHGQWTGRTIPSFLDQVKSLGFNALRIPLSPESLEDNRKTSEDYTSSIHELTTLMAEADQRNIKILFDIHNCTYTEGHTSGRPDSCPGSTINDWHKVLTKLANLVKPYRNVVGIDLYNEPYDLTWQQWRDLVNEAAKQVLQTNPHILIFVEGVANLSPSGREGAFWGENLYEALKQPVSVPRSRLVFSPHAYGPSVHAAHTYFAASNFPNNMPEIWDEHFGYLIDQGYPIAVGEFGGRYTDKDKLWQDAFVAYLKQKGIKNFFYWSLNPNSGDTGGILLDDWKSVDDRKVNLLQPLLK